MSRKAAKWILRNTIISRESLTPEISLRLITEASPLWMATPDACPLADPYWAFYWPGGQAITRYLLDSASSLNNSAVLDFGAGCGSAAMAASIAGARRILVNDIDRNALLATRLNWRLNGLAERRDAPRYSGINLLQSPEADPSFQDFFQDVDASRRFLILGDMFYDSDFAEAVFQWLKSVRLRYGVRILVGDPDRHPLSEQRLIEGYSTRFTKQRLASYPLPGYVTKEHYGFTSAHVYEIDFDC